MLGCCWLGECGAVYVCRLHQACCLLGAFHMHAYRHEPVLLEFGAAYSR